MPRFFAFALLLVASSARAVCPLNLRLADPLTLTWDNVPGIKSYEVQESFDNFGQTLMPILQEIGIDAGVPEIVETHNVVRG